MEYRRLGKTNLMVSQIGLGGEWLEGKSQIEVSEIICYAKDQGINLLDCWMSEPTVRSNIGEAIKNDRASWIIQGHIGSTWQNGEYVRSRDIIKVQKAFDDLLERLKTDYLDLGMIHYVDEEKDFLEIINGPFLAYVQNLKALGKIKHIGLSTHNPKIAKMAVQKKIVEMILFSINPAFDFLPATENVDDYFQENFDDSLHSINPDRAELYKLCEANDIGITVMKGFCGGRLFNKDTSPFKVALTPTMCLHYALTRPAVASVLGGFASIKEINESLHYFVATAEEKDYASILANSPKHAYIGDCTYCGHCAFCPKHIDIAMINKLYDLATMQEKLPASIKNHYDVLKAHASDCIECGNCMKHCPFGVDIITRMKKTKTLFGK